MNIKYLDSDNHMVVIPNVAWFSFVALPIDICLTYYQVGDDNRHEFMLPAGTPCLVDMA